MAKEKCSDARTDLIHEFDFDSLIKAGSAMISQSFC